MIDSGDEDGAALGLAVSRAGDVNGDGYADVIVGASWHDAGAGIFGNRGRAYVYLGSSGGLATTPAWVASGDEDGAAFGCAVSGAGDVNGDGLSDVIVGASLHDLGTPGSDQGTAYVYIGTHRRWG